MKKILKGLGIIAGIAAVAAGGKLIYDHYNDHEEVVEDVVETTDEVEETIEEVTPVVDETIEGADTETTV